MPDYQYHYNFTRVEVPGGFDCPANPARVDGEGKQIHLATEIEAALPGKIFCICAEGSDCDVKHETELSSGDETTQAGVVAAHKNNT